jgi:hypothetical protein
MWVQRSSSGPSAWKQMEAWRAKQKQHLADQQALNDGLLSAVMDTFSATSDGLIEITVRKALAAAQQRAAERAAKLKGIDLSI